MSKIKVRFKIQGLELEIEGDRGSVPEISQALQRQLAGMLSTPSAIVQSDEKEKDITATTTVVENSVKPTRKKTQRNARASTTGEQPAAVSVEFSHDPERWGNPKQEWTTARKAIWLLYVLDAQANVKDLSGSQIAATFNKHFRQAGLVVVGNVNRDLGVAKGKSPATVGEDNGKNPPAWFLTDTGRGFARKLVDEATGKAEQ